MGGVEVAAPFVPFGDDDDRVGAGEGLVAVFDVVELGVDAAGVLDRGGVGDGDLRAQAVQAHGDVEGGGVADVVGVRLERGAEDGDVLVVDGAAEGGDGEVDGAVASAEVDRVDLAEEGDGFALAEFFGAGAERADVLREAAAAEADAGAEELAADAGVVADRVGEGGDVGSGDFGDLGHGVDEADLRGEERVGGDLDEFRGGVVGDDEGRVLGDRGVVHLAEHVGAAFPFGGGVAVLGRHAGDEPVGVDGVLHGPALAEELGVPHQRRAGLGDTAGEVRGRSDRNGRLPRDEVALGQVGQQPVDGGVDVGEVCRIPTGLLRRADTDEVHLRTLRGGHVGRERQTPG